MASIEIKTTSTGRQPVLSVLEGSLDFDEVTITQSNYAVKSILPLEIFINTPTVFLLNKFLLEPMIGPVADKWKQTVARHLHPMTPFNLVIKLTEEKQIYEAPLGTKHQITADIWDIVQKTVDVLKTCNLMGKISKVKFIPGESDDLLIFCYQDDTPIFLVDLQKGNVSEIPETKMAFALEREALLDDFVEAAKLKAANYRQSIEELDQGTAKW